MRIDNPSKENLQNYYNIIENGINKEFECIKYIDLGTKIVKLIIHAKDFMPLIEKQLTYTLKDSSDKYDATIILWNELEAKPLSKKLVNPKTDLRARIEMLATKRKYIDVQIFDDSYSKFHALVNIEPERGFISAYNQETNTYYYGVENLEPEEFIKEGHIFVQMFNKILKTPTSNLVHGAALGFGNNGILFCARGQRGKSTLAVLSMMRGFEYVSDDYLIMEKENDKLYTYPIYSIITLSPKMYNELYNELDGCRFVSNNARKDKYVINIAKFHPQFKTKYPISICMFPEIVSDKEPSIEPCEKGRAITQLIQSTVMQMNDLNDITTIKKMLNMVKDFEFYKINLCSDIERNTEFLRDFMNNIDKREHKKIEEDKIFVDITYDLANILNSETGTIYSMNKFATNVFENLKEGVSQNSLLNMFEPYGLATDLNLFVEALLAKGILKDSELESNADKTPNINMDFAKEDNFKLSLIEFNPEERTELVKEKMENKNEQLCIK